MMSRSARWSSIESPASGSGGSESRALSPARTSMPRGVMLSITARGAQVRAGLAARLDEPPEPLAGLSLEDQRALRDIMRRALGRA